MAIKEFIVGRDLSADIPVADESVSRRHAELRLIEGGKLFVTDCHSSNGTFIIRGSVERRISQETVEPSDTLRFGTTRIPVSALVEAIKAKASPAPAARPPSPPSPSPRPPLPSPGAGADPGRLIRCICGAVKPAASSCPVCGQ